MAGSWRGPSVHGGGFLWPCPQLEGAQGWPPPLLRRTLIPSQGSSLMTSSKPNCSPKALSPNTMRGLEGFGEDTSLLPTTGCFP